MKIDILECVERLRPGLSWKNHMVNGYSLETIEKTYLNPDAPLPTLAECEAVWPEIAAEHVAIKQARLDIKAEKKKSVFKGKTLSQAKKIVKDKFNDVRADKADDKTGALIDACEDLISKLVIEVIR